MWCLHPSLRTVEPQMGASTTSYCLSTRYDCLQNSSCGTRGSSYVLSSTNCRSETGSNQTGRAPSALSSRLLEKVDRRRRRRHTRLRLAKWIPYWHLSFCSMLAHRAELLLNGNALSQSPFQTENELLPRLVSKHLFCQTCSRCQRLLQRLPVELAAITNWKSRRLLSSVRINIRLPMV